MCEKKPYCGTRVDPCLQETIKNLNQYYSLKTIACCCGHGRYPKTILIHDRTKKDVYDLFTKVSFPYRKNHRYYKRDKDGHFYIPEVLSYYGQTPIQ